MSGMRSASRVIVLAALAAGAASCGDVVRDSRAPVVLVLNTLQGAPGNKPGSFGVPLSSDVVTNVTTPLPCTTTSPCPTVFDDLGQAAFAVVMKDTTIAPTSNNQVTLTSYHVQFIRSDGRNVEGVDVPYAFSGGMTLTIAAGGTGTASFELVKLSAKQETPLVQLITNPIEISTVAQVTFYGTDLVGNAVSVMGTISVNFANFGDQ
jgi:hypothetical protein